MLNNRPCLIQISNAFSTAASPTAASSPKNEALWGSVHFLWMRCSPWSSLSTYYVLFLTLLGFHSLLSHSNTYCKWVNRCWRRKMVGGDKAGEWEGKANCLTLHVRWALKRSDPFQIVHRKNRKLKEKRSSCIFVELLLNNQLDNKKKSFINQHQRNQKFFFVHFGLVIN